MRILSLIFLSAIICGCECPRIKCAAVEPKRASLAAKLAEADRIVITNLDAPTIKQFQGFRLELSSNETCQTVKDVSGMYGFSTTTPPTMRTNSSFNWELRFYRGAFFLASIQLGSSTFEYGNDEFGGDNGALDALSARLSKLTMPPEER
jgi:hypothetical protein